MISIARAGRRATVVFALLSIVAIIVPSALGSSNTLIDRAVAQGKLTSDLATIYKALAIVHPEALPAEYRSAQAAPDKCATGPVRDAMQVILANPDAYSTYRDIMSRPQAQMAYLSPQGHFWLHYDTTGTHAVPLADTNSNGVPDYVEKAGAVADSAWRYEVVDLGHLPPPSDGTLGGGQDQYDIYFQWIGAYGYTQAELPGPQPWNDYSSHIVVHNNFIGFPPNQDPEGNVYGALKVTIAHEFYHAVQFAYDVGAELYFMEESSTWMEDMVYPEVNDNYNYLPYFYPSPQTGLQSTDNNHQYAAFIWPKFLQERFGPEVMRAIWSDCRYNSAIGSWSMVLDSLGTRLQDEFTRFLIWNYHTGNRSIPGTFQSGADYPQVHIMRVTETIPDSDRTSSEPPDPLASNYIEIDNFAGARGILTVDFTGLPTVTWGLGYIVDYGSGQYFDSVYTTFHGTSTKVYVPHFENALRVIFIPGVSSSFGGAVNYSYDLYLKLPGDFDGSNTIDISDAVAGVNYIFGGGAAPIPVEAMDANCDGYDDISDVTYLIQYIFGNGPAPCR